MFIAKFNTTLSDKFKANKHGVPPLIGTVLAGTATATIIDGTIFENAKNIEGQLYLCENGVRTYEGKEYPTVDIVMPINSALEFISLRKEIGAGKLIRVAAAATPVAAPVPVADGLLSA